MEHEKLSALKNRWLCSFCISHRELKEYAHRDGEPAPCSYCRYCRESLRLSELAEKIESLLERDYVWCPTEQRGPGYDHPFDGETIDSIVRGFVNADDAVDDILEVMRSIFFLRFFVADEAGEIERREFSETWRMEGSPYDSHCRYEEVPGANSRNGPWLEQSTLESFWRRFERRVREESRFFSQVGEGLLATLFRDLYSFGAESGVLVEAGPDTSLTSLYRARVFQSDREMYPALLRPDVNLGPPPSSRASAGRMNAAGISIFYGASDAQTAVAEVRSPVGSRVVTGEFIIVRPLTLLDIGLLGKLGISLGSREPDEVDFLKRLAKRFSKPVMPDDEPFDYLITQVVFDFLANYKEVVLDGVIYTSPQSAGGGNNIALFHKSSRVTPIMSSACSKLALKVNDCDAHGFSYEVVDELVEGGSANGRVSNASQSGYASIFSQDQRAMSLQVNEESLVVHQVLGVSITEQRIAVSRSHDILD